MLFSCETNESTDKKGIDSTKSISKKVTVDTNSFEFGKGKISQVQARSVPGRVQGEILREFLPKDIPSSKSYPPSMTVTTESGRQVVTVSKEYQFPGNGSAMISIVDYGVLPKNEQPQNFKEFYNATTSLNEGVIREKFTFSGQPGCMVADESRRNGIAHGLIGNRFVVKVEGTSIPASLSSIGALLQFINSEELIVLGSSVQ